VLSEVRGGLHPPRGGLYNILFPLSETAQRKLKSRTVILQPDSQDTSLSASNPFPFFCELATLQWTSREHLLFRPPNKKPSYRRDSAGRRSLHRSRSFKVINFGTNRKRIRGFPLVINTNSYPISHRFQVIAYYWSNLRFRWGFIRSG